MYRKSILSGCLLAIAAALILLHAEARAQSTTQKAKPSIVERLDRFGQSLMGGLLPRKKTPGQAPQWRDPSLEESRTSRSGSVLSAGSQAKSTPSPQNTASKKNTAGQRGLVPDAIQGLFGNKRDGQPTPERTKGNYYGSPYRSAAASRSTQSTTVAPSPTAAASSTNRRMVVGTAPQQSPTAVSPEPGPSITVRPTAISVADRRQMPTAASSATATQRSAGTNASAAGSMATPTSSGELPSGQPIHQRLQRFRQSVFGGGSTGNETPARVQTVATPHSTPHAAAVAPVLSASDGQPTLAPPRSATGQPGGIPIRAKTLTPPPNNPPTSTGRPTLAPPRGAAANVLPKEPWEQAPSEPAAQKPTPAPARVTVPGTTPITAAPSTQDSAATKPAPQKRTLGFVEATPNRRIASRPVLPKKSNERVLLTRRSPILNVRTLGPARIAVGKRSNYEVHMENLGEVAAEDVVVTIALPRWADVVATDASSGAVVPQADSRQGKKLLWKIGPMEAKTRQKVVLGIVPRQSRSIDLAVRWDFTPIVSQAIIEVEEPKLAMRLGGPREVRFGEPQVFKLQISNTGNGAADAVVLTVMPLVPGQGAPSRHSLGTLPAGGKKNIELELTAGQTGTLAVRMQLECDGPAKASLNESLLVRKAEVDVKVDAPKMQYTGTVAAYRVHVKNSGNATAENLTVAAKLPTGAKLVEADGSGKATANGKAVEWKLARLAAGEERTFVLKCSLQSEGYSQLKANVTGKKISAEATAVTRVESIADLTLSVKDPAGPVPVGEKAVYTVRIRNRGTKAADGVEAVVYFSKGIEPVSAEGARYTIRPGQVLFDAIGTVPAGKDVVLKVVAKAEAPGNHMFRAEVYCRPLGTKLVSEETTRFYRGDVEPGSPRTMIGERLPDTSAATADRRNQPETPAPAETNPQPEPQRY